MATRMPTINSAAGVNRSASNPFRLNKPDDSIAISESGMKEMKKRKAESFIDIGGL